MTERLVISFLVSDEADQQGRKSLDFIICFYDNNIMNLLNYLVTSDTRKELLKFLWAQNVEASGHQLAQLTGAAYSSVHAELEGMKNEGLVTFRREGRAMFFRKNENYSGGKTLKSLLNAPKAFVGRTKNPTEDDVRLNLSKFGAPLGVHRNSGLDLPLEETLLSALTLARRDATVARILPVVFAKTRDVLDLSRLEFLARRHGLLPVLGFFLDLTAFLMGSRKLHAEAQRLMDRRRKRMENFFVHRKPSSFEKELAERNTPGVARAWHFLMNMGMDSFEGPFRKACPEV